MAMHEFEDPNGLGGPQHDLARSKKWRNAVLSKVESRDNKVFDFFHAFRLEDYRDPPSPKLQSVGQA